MKKITFSLLILCASSLCTFAQSADTTDLNRINSIAKNPATPPEQLDNLVYKLRPFAENPDPQQAKLVLDTYRAISNQYGANNHFKQAYLVFQTYLAVKEKQALAEKNAMLEERHRTIAERRKKDEDAILSVQNKVEQLRSENGTLESHRIAFKRFFSFAVIGLSALFAAMLVSSGLKINSLRTNLQQSRKKILDLNRKATLGRMADGIAKSFRMSLEELKKMLDETRTSVQSSGAAKKELALKHADQSQKILSELDQNFKD